MLFNTFRHFCAVGIKNAHFLKKKTKIRIFSMWKKRGADVFFLERINRVGIFLPFYEENPAS
jgi:hypothetical protein